MTYYEEFALTEKASVDEIHKAYKRLTKLLHPDLQSDPELQSMAEIQMKRLNAVLSVLTDPVSRRLYDQKVTLPVVSASKSVIRSPWMTLGCATLCLAAGVIVGQFVSTPYSLFRGTPAVMPDTKVIPAVAQVHKSYSARTNAPDARLHLHGLKPEPSETLTRNGPNPQTIEPPNAIVPAVDGDIDPHKLPVPRVEPEGVRTDGVHYAGYWLYAPVKSAKPGEALYPPEYIEMKIAEKEGAVDGIYRARYRVADRPISPSVVFHFAGNATGAEPVFSWTGEKGARGEVKFKQLSENLIEVTWHTTEFGGEVALGAGTAILTRRTD
jgi:hypothetical protein